MHSSLSAIAIAGLATGASAGPTFFQTNSDTTSSPSLISGQSAGINGVQFDLSGFQSVDSAGSPLNDTFEFALGTPGVFVYGIAWDITISTVGTSWLSEVNIGFSELAGQPTIPLGAGDDTPGTATYSSGGELSLPSIGIPEFNVDSDGGVSFEIYESFDDVTGSADATFLQGSSITLYYVLFPAPGSLGLLGLGAIAMGRRRR
ncbi:MAG: hypothetical protein AB8F26_08165 [Phycisphaerales bacterium]